MISRDSCHDLAYGTISSTLACEYGGGALPSKVWSATERCSGRPSCGAERLCFSERERERERGCVRRYERVGHLGPFEAPAQIAQKALQAFAHAESQKDWDRLPKGWAVTLANSKL